MSVQRLAGRIAVPAAAVVILYLAFAPGSHRIQASNSYRREVHKLNDELQKQHELNMYLREATQVQAIEREALALEKQITALQEENSQLQQATKMGAGAAPAAAAPVPAADMQPPAAAPGLIAAAANSAIGLLTGKATTCVVEKDTDFFGNDIGDYHVADSGECCKTCLGMASCQAWTYVKEPEKEGGVCWMKKGVLSKSPKLGITSGTNPNYKPPEILPPGVIPRNHRNQVIHNISAYHQGLLHLLDIASRTSKEPSAALQKLQDEVTRWNLFGPLLNAKQFPDTKFKYVVSVLCSNRPLYLQLVLDALERTAFAQEVLVVVSHDGIYYDTMAVAAGVTKLRVKQIFFPISRHIAPYEFPGDAKTDCPGGWSKRPPPAGCTGDKDHYGHYRESRVCAIKHHWWWLQNMVWDVLPHTSSALGTSAGWALFLEEDHVVSDDYVETLNGLTGLIESGSAGKEVRAVSLDDGQGAKSTNMHFSSAEATVARTGSSWGGNMGYAWNRELWKDIKQHNDVFCTVDDSNWDFSIEQIFNALPAFRRVHPTSKRVQHVGSCGMHIKNQACEPNVKPFPDFRKESASTWTLSGESSSHHRKTANNGGWGDKRDHALCKRLMDMGTFSRQDVSKTLPHIQTVG